jgi:hypothetical protein
VFAKTNEALCEQLRSQNDKIEQLESMIDTFAAAIDSF